MIELQIRLWEAPTKADWWRNSLYYLPFIFTANNILTLENQKQQLHEDISSCFDIRGSKAAAPWGHFLLFQAAPLRDARVRREEGPRGFQMVINILRWQVANENHRQPGSGLLAPEKASFLQLRPRSLMMGLPRLKEVPIVLWIPPAEVWCPSLFFYAIVFCRKIYSIKSTL